MITEFAFSGFGAEKEHRFLRKKKNHLVDMLKYRPASYSEKVHFETGTVILWKVKNKQGL